jgi:hypothetical protein
MSADGTLPGATPLFGTQRGRQPGREPGMVT